MFKKKGKLFVSLIILIIGCGGTPVKETSVQKKEVSVTDAEKTAPPKTSAALKHDQPSGYSKSKRGITVNPISPLGTRVSGNQWLLVIGIDTYMDWPRLKTAASDARSVRDILLSRYHFEQDYLIELYDERATRSNILSSLRFLAKNIRENDSLVIFYAGHGHLDPITKEGSWIPVESGTKDVSAWISNHDIKNYLRVDAIKAKHILLISDSCFAGDFFRGHRGKLPEVTDGVIKRAYKLTSRQAITSGGLEPVSDAGFGQNSVFSHFLIKALKENQKPFLIPSDLFPYVKAGVAQNAEQFPQFGSLSGTGGQQGGELVLFFKQDARIERLGHQTIAKQQEYERLKQMAAAADETRRKEAAEVSRREAALAELDADIEAMRKRLGTAAVRTDDSLDAMLAMVRQKEEQEKKLEELRRQREEEEKNKIAEVERLRRKRNQQIIEMLKPEVEKYKMIVASKYGESLKSDAWNALIAKCPAGWADGVREGDFNSILSSPYQRKYYHAEERRKKEYGIAMAKKQASLHAQINELIVDVNNEFSSFKRIHILYESKMDDNRFNKIVKLCNYLRIEIVSSHYFNSGQIDFTGLLVPIIGSIKRKRQNTINENVILVLGGSSREIGNIRNQANKLGIKYIKIFRGTHF